MTRTEFKISQMDCPSEEQMIRMKLSGIEGINSLAFDIANRRLDVYHEGNADRIDEALLELDLGSELIATEEGIATEIDNEDHKERKLLWTVLAINFLFFVVEMTTGLISNSMGLVADSLDMLADSSVYVLALMAVGATIAAKNRVARFAGYFQMILAVIGFVEVIRRVFWNSETPDFGTMIIVSFLALIANAVCLIILQKGKSGDAHMKASMIFTSNDIVINAGVIVAGILVHYFNSNYPDLIIGAIVFVIVANGSLRILKLAPKGQ